MFPSKVFSPNGLKKSLMIVFAAALLHPLAAATPARSPNDRQAHSCSWRHNAKHVLAFGDSYTYIQGTYGYPGYSFIGSYLPNDFAYTPEQLLESRISQNYTSQSAGGPNWVEFLTGCAVKKGQHSPLDCDVQLWDFAFAGANTDETLLPLHHLYTVPLVNQTYQFLRYGDAALRKHAGLKPSMSLMAIWIGINDINDAYSLGKASREFFVSNIKTMLNKSVLPLVKAGYKDFVFLNLPPLDRRPSNNGKPRSGVGKDLVDIWNHELEKLVKSFGRKHRGVDAAVFNANRLLNKVLDNPKSYGISNTANFCEARLQWPQVIDDPAQFDCQPVSEYFWFDSGHIGTKAHKAVAQGLDRFLCERF
ncbi:hypothetical protein FZEAL_4588 [Fusarium zealandicum]|uniref:Lysophospholipase A n=1 Tax=Fusarium zealandicum TaxID=1053134 RepID=A0A8H4UM86_9HYPO|nr:hypothetical protein FZEAL_4588 [Fusarium zealandicum]